jgi:hypothetical protein
VTFKEEEYAQIAAMPHGMLGQWLGERFPGGVPIQWWGSVISSANSSVSPLLRLSPEEAVARFEFGARITLLSSARGEYPGGKSACGIIGLAIRALQYEPELDNLPDIVTPDGAASWALDSMPVSREQARDLSAQQDLELEKPESSDPSPLCFPVPSMPDHRWILLDHVREVNWALGQIADKVTDQVIVTEIYAWSTFDHED